MILLEEKLYTSEETASILGISLRTLYRYLKKGEIEAETKTQSGTFRFTRKQIYKYLYPDKYSDIVQKLKINDQGFSPISYMDDEDFKKSESIPAIKPNEKFPETPKSDENIVENTNVTEVPLSATPVTAPDVKLNISNPVSTDEASKIIEQRENKDLTSELENLEALLGSSTTTTTNAVQTPDPVTQNRPPELDISASVSPVATLDLNSAVPNNISPIHTAPVAVSTNSNVSNTTDPTNTPSLSNSTTPNAEEWLYFSNVNKDILDLAREVNSQATETGRKYAATMRGGLSLHHDIDEFNLVHFYIMKDDLNWFVEQLELQKCDEKDANICLITTNDSSIFDSSYKLRGLTVVSDSRLIQDLMSHNEKELAKTLL